MIRDHKNTIYRMLSFIINTFQELPNFQLLVCLVGGEIFMFQEYLE